MSAQNGMINAALSALEGQFEAPLLENQSGSHPRKSPGQKAMRKTFKGTAHLANLLPTGSVLAFQILSPPLTNEGKCKSTVSQCLSLGLIGACGLSCFLLSFTDSIRDERGKVRYGVATMTGLWILDGSTNAPPEESAKYRLNFMDFLHAFLSLFVFGAVAMFDQNVVNCLYPHRSDEMREFLIVLPIFVGIFCSLMFLTFPTKRHGIGFPLSRN